MADDPAVRVYPPPVGPAKLAKATNAWQRSAIDCGAVGLSIELFGQVDQPGAVGVDLQFGQPLDVLCDTRVLANADADAPSIHFENRRFVAGTEPDALLLAEPSLAIEDDRPGGVHGQHGDEVPTARAGNRGADEGNGPGVATRLRQGIEGGALGIDRGGLEFIARQRKLGKDDEPGAGITYGLRVDRPVGTHVTRHARRLGNGKAQRTSHRPTPSCPLTRACGSHLA